MELLYVHRKQSVWIVNLTTLHHLMPRLRMAGAITPLNPYAFTAGMVTVSFQFLHFQTVTQLLSNILKSSLSFISLYFNLHHKYHSHHTKAPPTTHQHLHTHKAPNFPARQFFFYYLTLKM